MNPRLCVIVLAALLTCPSVSFAEEPHPIKVVGVVAVTGTQLTVKEMGWTAFSNSRSSVDIQGWSLGSELTAQFVTKLSPFYETRSLATSIATSDKPTDLSETVRNLAKLPRTDSCDAYVVIYPGERSDSIGGTDTKLSGVGLYRHPATMGGSGTHLFTSYVVALVDGRNFATLAQTWLEMPRQGGGVAGLFKTLSTFEENEFSTTITDDAWPDPGGGTSTLGKRRLLKVASSIWLARKYLMRFNN